MANIEFIVRRSDTDELLEMKDAEIEWGWACTSCDFATTDDVEDSFECGGCGRTFTRSDSYDGDSNKCPDCRKFSSKLGPRCGECDEEVERVDVVICPRCEEYIAVEKIGTHFFDCEN